MIYPLKKKKKKKLRPLTIAGVVIFEKKNGYFMINFFT